MTDFDRTLEQRLREHADHISVAPGDIEAVMARGLSRRWRRRALAAGCGGTATAVAVATVVLAVHRSPSSTVVTASSPAATPATPGGTSLTWQAVTPTSALGVSTAITGSAPLYAVSTAPGVSADPTNTTQVIYRSADGLEWTPASSPSDLYVADLSADPTELYAVGTGPSVVGASSVAGFGVAWSSDQGRSWHQAELPLDTASISAGTMGDAGKQVKVATGQRGTVVVAALSVALNLPQFLPAGVSAPAGWTVTPTGVDVLAGTTAHCPPGSSATPVTANRVARTILKPGSPAVAPMTPQAVPPGQVTEVPCFTTGATGKPEQVTSVSPETAYGVSDSYTWAQLGISGELRQAVLGQPFAWFSADGTTFQPVHLPATTGASGLLNLMAADDGFTLAASGDNGGPVVLQSPDGTTWNAVPAPTAIGSDVAALGDLDGQVAIVSQEPNGVFLSTLGGNGQWTQAPLGADLQGSAATAASVDVAAIGPLGVVALVSTSTPGSDTTTASLAFSPNGTTWSIQPLSGLTAGSFDGSDNAVVTATNAIVTVSLAPAGPGQQAQTVALVGTPR